MKLKLNVIAIAAMFLAAGLVGCKEPQEVMPTITATELTFEDNGWTSANVEIQNADSWQLYYFPEWVDTGIEGNRLIITPQANVGIRQRKGEVVIHAFSNEKMFEFKVAVTQAKSEPKIINLAEKDSAVENLPADVVSPNGRYVAGTRASKSFVYDMATETAFVLGSGGGMANPPELSTGQVIVDGISNNGIVVGSASKSKNIPNDPDAIDLMPFSYDVVNKIFKWLRLDGLEVEAITNKTASSSYAWAISADGTVIAGSIGLPASANATTRELRFIPVVWKGDQIIVLKHTQDGLGIVAIGYRATRMSADGKIITGYVVPSGLPRYMGCFWRVDQPDVLNFPKRDDPAFFDTEPHPASMTDVPSKYIRIENISDDGKIITGTFEDFTAGGSVVKTPMSYNMETGETVMATNVVGDGGGVFTLSDGTIVYYGSVSSIFYKNGEESLSMSEWMQAKHNKTPEYGDVFLRDASASGKVMVGYRNVGGTFYPIIISL